MPKKILIIEDEESLAELYRIKFEQEGFAVLSCETGPEGLAIAEKEAPDLILLDIMLPKMDGYQVLRGLKSSERTREIKVFFLSNLVQSDEIKKGIAAGADDYLVKSSLTPSQLAEKVRNFFELQAGSAGTGLPAANEKPAAPDLSGEKRGGAPKVLLIEDNDSLIEMYLQQFMRDGFDTEVAKNGAWGIKLAKNKIFDIIILDMVMPAMDGHRALKDLRSDGRTKDIPIIILSNSAQENDIEKARQEGASAYLLKSSVTPIQITREIFKLLSTKQ